MLNATTDTAYSHNTIEITEISFTDGVLESKEWRSNPPTSR